MSLLLHPKLLPQEGASRRAAPPAHAAPSPFLAPIRLRRVVPTAPSRHHPARVHVAFPSLPFPLISSARTCGTTAPPRVSTRTTPTSSPRSTRTNSRTSTPTSPQSSRVAVIISLARSVVVATSPLDIVPSTPTCTSSSNTTWTRDGANSPRWRARRSPPPSRHPSRHPRLRRGIGFSLARRRRVCLDSALAASSRSPRSRPSFVARSARRWRTSSGVDSNRRGRTP